MQWSLLVCATLLSENLEILQRALKYWREMHNEALSKGECMQFVLLLINLTSLLVPELSKDLLFRYIINPSGNCRLSALALHPSISVSEYAIRFLAIGLSNPLQFSELTPKKVQQKLNSLAKRILITSWDYWPKFKCHQLGHIFFPSSEISFLRVCG